MRRVLFLGIILIIFAGIIGGGSYWLYLRAHDTGPYRTVAERDPFVRFDMEVYDTIDQQYVQKGAPGDLPNLFRLSLQKALNAANVAIATTTRSGTAQMLSQAFSGLPDDQKRKLAVNVAAVALANLAPQGRSGLLSAAQEKQFRDTVNNINPSQDLYATLGLSKGATAGQIQNAYQQESAALKASTSPQAQSQLKQVAYAYQVLTSTTTKDIYDQTKMQPSVFSRVLHSSVLYVDMSKVTPATFTEFVQDFQNQVAKNPNLASMILDLRGNIGGSLDFVQYFLALFLGPNQYAFDLYHQGNLDVQRTPAIQKLPALSRFREIAILTDGMTQSTAELLTATFKRYHLAYVVGTKTRGWGTVENTFPIETQIATDTTYSILLVHALTLRPDNQPIQGNGVDPDVNVGDKNWQQELGTYFRSAALIESVIQEEKTAPPQA